MIYKREEIKEYFKDKIDWKVYNYLLSKLTPFEDKDILFDLEVMIPDINSTEINFVRSTPIYIYNSADYSSHYADRSSSMDRDTLSLYYEAGFLIYSIFLRGMDTYILGVLRASIHNDSIEEITISSPYAIAYRVKE